MNTGMASKWSLSRKSCQAFSLIEVIIAMAISTLVIGGIIYGYVGTSTRAEWTGYSLAAQSLTQQKLEQVRSAKWDQGAIPTVDEVVSANFPPETNILDVPITGTNVVRAVLYTSITTVQMTPPLKQIGVECVWNFMNRRWFTNRIVTFRSPDS